ncbi:MAG TPA: GNAT family N-acetyltransferase [Flavobacteriales bacterium]|nr:GNAT family N-acetyltransferase [Flavobacteriales bacterium]HMZ47336.1 GNAT family N-acetyltransferase [Flavobacteriales bacterium]HNA32724.1 GNAT family N-acetyltransferase [Flavobacteriales bacterium]
MTAFSLRPFRHNDLLALVRHANDPTVAAFLTDLFPHPYTEENGRKFLEEAMKPVPLRRCIEVDDECIGAIGLHPKQDLWRYNMELGYWLARAYRGKGIITSAIRQMVRIGFATFPDVTRIYASPFGSNIASQQALEKAGFTLEAKLIGTLVKNGKVEDEWIYGIRRD